MIIIIRMMRNFDIMISITVMVMVPISGTLKNVVLMFAIITRLMSVTIVAVFMMAMIDHEESDTRGAGLRFEEDAPYDHGIDAGDDANTDGDDDNDSYDDLVCTVLHCMHRPYCMYCM